MPQHEERSPTRRRFEEGGEAVLDHLLYRWLAVEPLRGELCRPPIRARPNEMAVLGPAPVVARPMSPIRRVADGLPCLEVLFAGNPKNLDKSPHRRIQINITAVL